MHKQKYYCNDCILPFDAAVEFDDVSLLLATEARKLAIYSNAKLYICSINISALQSLI